jgi:hypothetical protein
MSSIVAAQPADLIALAWYQLGYRPTDSLVMVGLHGPRLRTGVVVRSDLPPTGAEPGVLTSMAVPLARSGATSVVLLVCTADACWQSRPRVVRMARRLLPSLGLSVTDELAVGDTGYRSYGCRRPHCCPPAGRPLTEVLGSRVAAELVLEGHSLLDGESSLVADVQPDETPDDAGPTDHRGRPGTGSEPPDRAAVLRDWRLALRPEQTRPGQASPSPGPATDPAADPVADRLVPALGPALNDSRLRDAVMLTLVPGADRLADEVLAGAGADAIESTLGTAPDHELLERGVRLLAAAARTAPPGHRAGPLGALAWLAWWSGQGGRARLLVERALADQPGHRLTMLVDGLLELAVPPPWVPQLPSLDDGPDGIASQAQAGC